MCEKWQFLTEKLWQYSTITLQNNFLQLVYELWVKFGLPTERINFNEHWNSLSRTPFLICLLSRLILLGCDCLFYCFSYFNWFSRANAYFSLPSTDILLCKCLLSFSAINFLEQMLLIAKVKPKKKTERNTAEMQFVCTVWRAKAPICFIISTS